MIAATIVLLSLLFAIGFTVAWVLRPDLRAWIERPKHRFQAHVERYDHVQCGEAGSKERRTSA